MVAAVICGVIGGVQLVLHLTGEICQCLHSKIAPLTATLCCLEELSLLLEGIEAIRVWVVPTFGVQLVSTPSTTQERKKDW